MLKKFTIIIVIILFIFGFNNISLAVTPNVYIGDVIKKQNEDKVTMDVHIENIGSDIASLRLNIKFDEKKVEYISSKAGKNLKATVKMSEAVEGKNKVAIGIASSSGLKTDGIYYQITFKVLDNKISEIPVNLELTEATDTKGNNVKCDVASGKILTSEKPKPPVEDNKNPRKR